MTAGLWVRGELRRRWRALLALGLLAGLVGGAVLAATAGGRRASSAFDRLLDRTNATHVDVQLSTDLAGSLDAPLSDGGRTPRQVIEVLRKDERVEALGLLSYMQVGPEDVELGAEFISVAAMDRQAMRTVEIGIPVRGRLPDPDDPHQVAVNELAAEQFGWAPGDRVEFVSRSPAQLERLVIEGDPEAVQEDPEGPSMTVRITGVVRGPRDVGQVDQGGPVAFLTPAFSQRYGPRVGQFGPSAVVRTVNGYADVPGLTALVEELTVGAEDAAVDDNRIQVEAVQDAVDVQAVALYLFAAVALLAGGVAVVQAVVRQLGAAADDVHVLEALGLTRLERLGALVAVAVPALAGAAVLAAAVAVAASTRLPLGLARTAEPEPGLDVDPLVVGAGTVGWLVLLLGAVGWAAWRLSRAASRVDRSADGAAPTPAARLATRLRHPSLITGLRMAFEARRGGEPVPVRPALLATGAAVTGIVAVLTFGASLDHLLDTPALSGYPWHVEVAGGEELSTLQPTLDELVDDPDVEGVLLAHIVGDTPIGKESVQAFGVRSLKGDAGLTIVAGRPPQAPDEVALGPETMRREGLSIGDDVASKDRDGRSRMLTIVGSALFPVIDDAEYTGGALLTDEGLDQLLVPTGFYDGLIRYRDGVDVAAKRKALEEEYGFLFPITTPAAVLNLREARGFPTAVAAFLGVLGVAAVVHALVLSGRRWRGDFAVLRSMGMLKRQLRGAVTVQASAIGVVGLLVGTPIGIAAGRWVWSLMAGSLDVVDRAVVPLTALAVAPAVLLAVNLLGLLPGRRVARLTPATVLRSE